MESSVPPPSRGHVRRTSEPIETINGVVGDVGEELVGGGSNETTREEQVDRRQQFRGLRGQSMGNLGLSSHSISSLRPQPPQLDLSSFHESWATSDGEDLFGSSFSGSFISTAASPAAGLDPLSISAMSPRSISEGGISSVIHDAARITNWDRVLELCKTNPEAAKYSGRDGWTALHHACNRRCPHAKVAEALIRAYPGALLQQEEKGWLPLHYACRFKAPKEVVRLLLHMYPEKGRKSVSKVERLGRTPLYYAIRYDAPPGVVGLLLQVDPSVVLEEDQNEDSPLALVWDSWAEKMEGKRMVNSYLPGGFLEPEDRTVEERAEILRQRLKGEPKLFKRWLKVNMLLKAAFGFPVEDDEYEKGMEDKKKSADPERKWRIVHATAAVKCHLPLFLLACALHPEQVQEFDERDLRRPGDPPAAAVGNTHQSALHLAASSNAGGEPGKTILLTLLSLYGEAAQLPDGIDGSLPLHRMVENGCKQDWSNHCSILYRFYPRAVQIPDSSGKLPLHRATAAIKHVERESEESVIIQLVRVFPQAASHADNSGCLPMHIIAQHAEVWDQDVEQVYTVHRQAVVARTGPDLYNRLPIHMAAASAKSRESLVARLIQHHPRGASVVDRQGKLPLHLACEVGKAWDDGTRSIHTANPGAIQIAEANSRGWLPLHLASNAPDANAALMQNLVDLHPQASEVPDTQGRFPLHLACSSGKSWLGGLEILFEANPVAMSTVDGSGLLPLHVAAFRYCATDSSLEEAQKEEEDTVDDASGKSKQAKDAALEAADLDIIFNLLRADPTVLAKEDY